MYKKIRLTQNDIQGMILEAVKKICSINEENVWNGYDDEDGTITMGRDFVLEYGVCAGEIDCETGEVTPEKGLDYRDLKGVQEALQSEIDFRKAHLQNSLGAFARKMNNLDPEIDITVGEFEPFDYTANVVLVMNLPTKTYVDPELAAIHGAAAATGKEFSKASEKTMEWIKSQGFTNNGWGQPLVFYKSVPGVPKECYKVGEVHATGYKCHVSYSKGGFRLGGYRFVGVVTPYTNADSDDTDALYADVKLTEEFADNATLADYLKKISAKIKCDGCGKKTSRSYYYVFMDKDDKLVFYGRNCAAKIFGIDIAEKLYNYMAGLNKLGEDFGGMFEGYNVPGDEIKQVMAVMIKDKILGERVKFDYKSVLYRAERIQYLLGVDKESRWMYKHDDTSDVDFYENNLVPLNSLLTDFLTNGGEFFRSIDTGRASDFVERVKAFGINVTSGDEKALKVASNWALPYALQMYFSTKMSRQKMEAQKDDAGIAGPYPAFDGYKVFDCTIAHTEEKTSKNGRSYLVVQAVTEENGSKYGIQWFLWEWDGNDVLEGKKLAVSGLYSKYNSKSSSFATLDNVKVSGGGNEVGPENIGQDQKQQINVGERLRGEQVIVKKVYDKSIIVTTSGGFDFYIYTKDFNTGAPKYPINFTQGMTLTVDGTMQISNNGKPYLNRCKIMG